MMRRRGLFGRRAAQTVLPLMRPSCGGPLDPREVEWVDETAAECGYCGSLVRAGEG
ncbi:MAG TPA: hypothetical protein VF806_01610 [Anaerolineaceae bacterium]